MAVMNSKPKKETTIRRDLYKPSHFVDKETRVQRLSRDNPKDVSRYGLIRLDRDGSRLR